MTHHRVVIVSVEVPKPQPTSAGERLIKELYDALEGMGKNPIVLAPKPAHGQESAYRAQHHWVDIAPRTRYLQKARSRFGTWTPNLEFLHSLKADSYAMKLLQEAETIDLQWSSNLLLAPFIRHLNPAATLVGTFHDISPQRFMRRARLEHNRLKAAVWGAHARLSACLEYAAVGALDHIVVLSDKDGSLLELRSSDADKVEVIRPPAYLRSQPIARSPQPAQLLFVGTMYRWENHEAVQWFIAEILPKIWLKHPEVTLKVVGESPSADIVALGSDERITF
ncbi:MAG: hypothetical protein Q3965_03245, partial [Rothia sp. (in: high G+C Gram-positive bacteria)]|nr:hypothetical protein [Rothia sp. (in: high G+C Gram-positive bacteria)]